MVRSLRVLVVEDSPADAELTVRALRQGGLDPSFERVETADALRAALTAESWDAVTSAYFLPSFGGPAALAIVRAFDPDLPFFIVSETVGEDAAVAMIRAGANDYVGKHDIARLAPAVEREVLATANRRAKRAAERTAAQLAAIVESSDDAIISKTFDGVITTWNSAAERLYGWTAAEAVGRHISFLIPPDKADELAGIMRRLRAGERIEYIETVRLHRDGRRIDLSMTISPIRDADGQMIGISKSARDIRERKRAEQELRRTSELLTAVADGTNDAVFVKDREGKYLLFNKAAAQFVGKPVEEVIGKDDTALFDAAGAKWVAERDRRVMATGLAETEEETLTASGVTRTYLSTKAPFRDETGIVVGVIGVSRDVTERKQADESLKRSETRYRRLFEAAEDGILIVDLVSRRVFDANPFLAALIGYTRDELIGKELWEIGLFRDIEANKHAFRTLQKTGHIRYDDLPLQTKDGRRIAVEFVSNVYDAGGAQVIQCNIRDITARKRIEDTLRLRNRAIQAIDLGILITDQSQSDNPIIYVSPGFERLTGYASEEVLGRNCRFLQGKDTDPAEVAHIREAIQTVQSCTVELLNYRKDGKPFWNELSISPIRDDAGRLTHFVGVQADVTARRNLEQQFRQAQKMEAVGQLAGGVAHDFNNLLTIINGYSDLLLQSLPQTDPSRDLIGEILKAGERSAGLTRQLLAFSRQQVLAPRVLDLNAVVTDTEKMLRRLLGEDVRLATALEPAVWAVRADPGQVEQVLMNLAVNARDAMPRGGRLTIQTQNVNLDGAYARTHTDARAGKHVLLSVTDTGTGMPPEVKAKIFEPFFTTKGIGKGTGLGLATVYGIVKQSGGHVGVYSEVGVGTTFKVYLPRVDQATGVAKTQSRIIHPARGTETILLVEDEDGVRSLTRHVLAGCGYTVLEAADGDKALALATRHDGPIHLLITDVVMPGPGGRAVAEQVAGRHPAVKVLFVSGYTDDAVIRHGVLREGVNFLQKPFSPIALTYKVREVLDATPDGADQ